MTTVTRATRTKKKNKNEKGGVVVPGDLAPQAMRDETARSAFWSLDSRQACSTNA
jgi:hypothetical protein